MAEFVIVYDEGGIVRVDRRPTPLTDLAKTGKKVADLVKDATRIINPVAISDKYGQLITAGIDARRSTRLTDAEKDQIQRAVFQLDILTDSVKRETIPGEFQRTHPIAGDATAPGAPQPDKVVQHQNDP